ncbi:MAG: glycosyltransferase family 39 protein [Candidatus Omnitrophica bacterium]|nr:glycosyltransferase family 39 protein [Candidatus Omnitrophota bacterium]MCM8802487.1 glycosyltransferase family 39 protein [Candidatus Omnitrophota bacterium]
MIMNANEKKFLIIIFFVSLIIRIGFILTLDNSVDVWGDWWDELGWKIASGKGYWVENPYFPDRDKFYAWRSPGFPIFLALIYKFFGHNYLAAKIGLAILSSSTCILLYFLARILINKKTAFLVSLIYSIYPASIFWTGYLAPETFITFLLVLSVFLLTEYYFDNKKILHFIFGNLFFGFLCITKPTFLALCPFLILTFSLIHKKNLFKILVVSFICLSFFPLLWGIRNYKIFNRFFITSSEGGIVFFIANNEQSLSSPTGFYHAENVEEFKGLSEIEIDKLLYKKTFEFIKNNPNLFFKLIINRFIKFWRLYPHTISGPGESYKIFHQILSFISETPIIIVGFLGILLSLKEFYKWILLYLTIFIYSGLVILIRTTIRYRFPIMGFLIIFALYFLKMTKYGKKYL